MTKNNLITICATLLFVLLSACSTFNSSTDRKAICNELKSKMTFNGNTSNFRTSEIQTAEDPMLQRQYDKYHCDQLT